MFWTDGQDIFQRFANSSTGSVGSTGMWIYLIIGGEAIVVRNFDATKLTNGTHALAHAIREDGL